MRFLFLFFIGIFCACDQQTSAKKEVLPSKEKKIFTAYSSGQNEYVNFNAPLAINKIADIENEYFNAIEDGFSKYYGTVWREQAETISNSEGVLQFQDYLHNLDATIGQPDSLHCTLYAYEGLKAGLQEDQLIRLQQLHEEQWKSREIAGWSIGYLLVKYFDWEAYLFIDSSSVEFDHCIRSFKRDKTYPVWRQPNIPLKEVFILEQQDTLINDLLSQHEFGWGFSEQGIHTWITRYQDLKECNWLGAPSKKYQDSALDKPLFITTPFSQYFDYASHVIVFPKKK